ncbi:uncharacterized protein LOC116765735 isoform X3 [Danaus plexippus]|uniref:uncharacterized protein LOC116765735 isoform X3 n=1 Tax=Danaus plexippus TaxID=13037 RepID=UPI0013C4F959|nr:uncharacterized protein LOC116765735 isoform X6 [Danaus plexippus plexippus]XP_061378083.1 uncharacterized protein LOC116765735 isoform X3 [Danaus plexippus]
MLLLRTDAVNKMSAVSVVAGSAVAMIGANLRFGSAGASNSSVVNNTRLCPPGGAASAAALLALSGLGMTANIALMAVILSKKQLRRWSHGLLFHQAMVDCARAAILLPLGIAVFRCQPVYKCSLVETAFLLLVTVSTVNMLTTVLNDSPIFPENEEEQADLSAPLLMDSPQCVLFGTFMIWFASITINLGPTFLSGALAASAGSYGSYGPSPSCPLVRGPFRHYVLNALWIGVNAVCVGLTLFHLRKLHRDLTKTVDGALADGHCRVRGSANLPLGGGRRLRGYLARVEREGVRRVRMFLVITAAYILFWGPLFFITLLHHPALTSHVAYELYFQITLHISYVHAAVNPLLFLALHRALRRAALQLCCGCCVHWSQFVLALTAAAQSPLAPASFSPAAASPEPPPAPPPPAPPHAPAPHTMMSWEVEECDAESMSSERVQGDEDMMEWTGVRRPRSPSPLLPAL